MKPDKAFIEVSQEEYMQSLFAMETCCCVVLGLAVILLCLVLGFS